jgi:hypothetical protein
MKDDKIKDRGNKVTTKATNVRSSLIVEQISRQNKSYASMIRLTIDYIRKSDIRPTQSYITASFDFSNDVVKSNKIHLSQLKLFVENER